MSYQVQGTVKEVGSTETFNSGSSKKSLVLTVKNGQYEDDLALDFWKDKVDLLNQVSIGDSVEVNFDVRSREYNGKYYTNCNGYKLNTLSSSPAPANTPEPKTKTIAEEMEDDGIDQLPF